MVAGGLVLNCSTKMAGLPNRLFVGQCLRCPGTIHNLLTIRLEAGIARWFNLRVETAGDARL